MSVANILNPSTGKIRQEYLLAQYGENVFGGANATLQATAPITFTGELSSVVLKANALYEYQMTILIGCDGAGPGTVASEVFVNIFPTSPATLSAVGVNITIPPLIPGEERFLSVNGLVMGNADATLDGDLYFSNHAQYNSLALRTPILTRLSE